MAPDSARQLALPILVFGLVEVRRLRRELESLEEFMRSSELRQPGAQPALPRLSRSLDALAAENHRNLLQAADRQLLKKFLGDVEVQAPTVHMSFASDPSSSFVAKVVSWLRGNIHPAVLLQIGLQPTIAAGCILRTNNKQFDFSLRESFTKNKPLLVKTIDDAATLTQSGVADMAAQISDVPTAAQPATSPAQPPGVA